MAKKALPWFRLYTEFSTDYKVQMMTESMQRRLVMLFCLQREDTLNSMSEGEICYRLGVSKKEWMATKKLFEEKGFKNGDDEIKNGEDFMKRFALRQFDSDDSGGRQRTYRKNLKLKGVSNNDVTTNSCDMSQRNHGLDTDTDTDTDKEKKNNKKKADAFLSGKPDDAHLSQKNSEVKKEAIAILNFLNEKSGKNYRPVDVNLNFIIARLKSGATFQQCKSVIAKKRRDWIGDENMAKYLRPATLFNKTKFEQYLGELIQVPEES